MGIIPSFLQTEIDRNKNTKLDLIVIFLHAIAKTLRAVYIPVLINILLLLCKKTPTVLN